MNAVQANELEMVGGGEDTRMSAAGLVSVIIHFMYFLLFLLLTHHLDAATQRIWFFYAMKVS